LELNQKKSRREIKNENLPNLSEENLIDGEISNSNNKINDSENIDNSKIKSYYSIDSEKK
jgi:hypothetical protein